MFFSELGRPVWAQAPEEPPGTAAPSGIETTGRFLVGALAGLVLHEGGHLVANVLAGRTPGLTRVDYAGIPFFAITHAPLGPTAEFSVSSAGFWSQHISSELLLVKHPRVRFERAPIRKGLLAFNLTTSVVYAVAASARTGPDERDTRGMALSARVPEPAIAPVVLVPAVLDAIRYFKPESRVARWASRAAKAGSVALILKARRP